MADKDTLDHIKIVQRLLARFSNRLATRAKEHDKSKLREPEKSLFDEYTPKLKNCTYGSDEYKQYLTELKVALDHHYAVNFHHPEHYENGIEGMDLVDVIEMLCDWKAATSRHNDGDIIKSLEININRFGVDKQLAQILLNTINRFGLVEREMKIIPVELIGCRAHAQDDNND